MRDFFTEEEPDDEPRDLGISRCTPEKLLAFIERCEGRVTLADCKREFGGILGALLCGWELQRQGRWPEGVKRRKR